MTNYLRSRFGTVALLLQLIPPLSMFFLMSTAVGSALWAVDIETKRGLMESTTDRIGEFHDDNDETNI